MRSSVMSLNLSIFFVFIAKSSTVSKITWSLSFSFCSAVLLLPELFSFSSGFLLQKLSETKSSATWSKTSFPLICLGLIFFFWNAHFYYSSRIKRLFCIISQVIQNNKKSQNAFCHKLQSPWSFGFILYAVVAVLHGWTPTRLTGFFVQKKKAVSDSLSNFRKFGLCPHCKKDTFTISILNWIATISQKLSNASNISSINKGLVFHWFRRFLLYRRNLQERLEFEL